MVFRQLARLCYRSVKEKIRYFDAKCKSTSYWNKFWKVNNILIIYVVRHMLFRSHWKLSWFAAKNEKWLKQISVVRTVVILLYPNYQKNKIKYFGAPNADHDTAGIFSLVHICSCDLTVTSFIFPKTRQK